MHHQILIDTHCHLYEDSFLPDTDDMIQRANDAGVKKMILPNIDAESISSMLYISDRYADCCLPMMGLHPCYVKEDYKIQLDVVAEWLKKKTFYGIGEIGLDYHWDLTYKEQQLEAFRLQLQWSLEKGLPVSIHSRESFEDCLEIVKEIGKGKIKGVFHCFGGTAIQALEVIDLGMYLGIGGVVTYKKTGLGETLKEVGLKNVVLETDAPYLPPVPYRGKRNESSYLKYICQKIADDVGISFAEVARITTENAATVFNFSL